jgi:hypothetical protein
VRLIKNVIGTLEVDPSSKTIWLNSLGRCVLRLRGDFVATEEKFSIIDGRISSAYLAPDKDNDLKSEKFMPNIISLVGFLISEIENDKIQGSKFFEQIEKEISRMINRNLEDDKMSILTDLLNELSSSDSDETLKKLCDKIYDQEVKHVNHPTILPSGPNIFLALECPDDFQKFNFVCLEREEKNKFIVSHWAVMKDTEHAKRVKVWDCRGLPNQKIVEQFLEKYNFLRGK